MIIHMRTAGNLKFPWDRLQAAALIFGYVLIALFWMIAVYLAPFGYATEARQKHSLDIS
jgi:hypothetical protein